jgi:maltodextrin utilization protein YvdJ
MCRFILDVNDQFGTTIVLIEHDMGVVMDISDRVVVLDYGKKIGDGTPDEVRSNQDVINATWEWAVNIFFFEVLIGGLLSGVMYALVAIGFVLIYKASGVFNFAQGAMVYFAALTCVGVMDKLGVSLWVALPITWR